MGGGGEEARTRVSKPTCAPSVCTCGESATRRYPRARTRAEPTWLLWHMEPGAQLSTRPLPPPPPAPAPAPMPAAACSNAACIGANVELATPAAAAATPAAAAVSLPANSNVALGCIREPPAAAPRACPAAATPPPPLAPKTPMSAPAAPPGVGMLGAAMPWCPLKVVMREVMSVSEVNMSNTAMLTQDRNVRSAAGWAGGQWGRGAGEEGGACVY